MHPTKIFNSSIWLLSIFMIQYTLLRTPLCPFFPSLTVARGSILADIKKRKKSIIKHFIVSVTMWLVLRALTPWIIRTTLPMHFGEGNDLSRHFAAHKEPRRALKHPLYRLCGMFCSPTSNFHEARKFLALSTQRYVHACCVKCCNAWPTPDHDNPGLGWHSL